MDGGDHSVMHETHQYYTVLVNIFSNLNLTRVSQCFEHLLKNLSLKILR
jgi:hypothetical protein